MLSMLLMIMMMMLNSLLFLLISSCSLSLSLSLSVLFNKTHRFNSLFFLWLQLQCHRHEAKEAVDEEGVVGVKRTVFMFVRGSKRIVFIHVDEEDAVV